MNHKVVCDVCAEMKTFYFRKQLCSASVFVLKTQTAVGVDITQKHLLSEGSAGRSSHAELCIVTWRHFSPFTPSDPGLRCFMGVSAYKHTCPPAHPLTVTLLRVFKELRMGNKSQMQ